MDDVVKEQVADRMGEESNVLLVPPRLALAFVVLDVDHDPVVAKSNGAPPLCVPLAYLEELILPYGLAAADLNESAQPL